MSTRSSRSLLQSQPDAQEYGYFFSYVLIWILNVAGVVAWIVCTSEVTWRAIGRSLAARASSAYLAVAQCVVWLYESVRSLSVLQG